LHTVKLSLYHNAFKCSAAVNTFNTIGTVAVWKVVWAIFEESSFWSKSVSGFARLSEALAIDTDSWEGTTSLLILVSTSSTWVLLGHSVLRWVTFLWPGGITSRWESNIVLRLSESLAVNANTWERSFIFFIVSTGSTWVLLSDSVLSWVTFLWPSGIATGWESNIILHLCESLAFDSYIFIFSLIFMGTCSTWILLSDSVLCWITFFNPSITISIWW